MRRILVTAVVSAALVAGGLGVTAGTASAATSVGWCDGTKELTINSQGHFVWQPYHKATGSRNCTLAEGAYGSAVTALQLSLRVCNFASNLSTDGEFGPATKKAVAYAQNRHGISSDGIYGPDSRQAFGWQVYANGVPSQKRCARTT
jgi:peptidoglycan hydrolase-like protein with peptidoglycan-binding domain